MMVALWWVVVVVVVVVTLRTHCLIFRFRLFLTQPLCEKHKKYIQNLDIEADARMLRERLNLCEEAVDYFRASSALLKAGVAAGLTLYDIAVLCCRNDNLAEEPSMMEKLFDMASELAHRAVESNRWHHTAASRALVEQLCPQYRRRSSMLSSVEDTRRAFYRSVSNAETASNSSSSPSDRSLLREAKDSPGMAPSSGSDSSSNNGDAPEEKEECEEWAATLIADLTEHQMSPVRIRPIRSESVSSDDGSSNSSGSCSPKGFWRIAPGSAKANDLDEDEESIQWSPGTSPCDSLGFDMMEPPSLLDIPAGKENNSELKTPTVTFAVETETFPPPATVNVTTTTSTTIDCKLPPSLSDADFLTPQEGSKMSRSKSYTALSATAGRAKKTVASSSRPSSVMLSEDYDNYKKYFHKFIDLVIVRETTAALHHSRHGADHVMTI